MDAKRPTFEEGVRQARADATPARETGIRAAGIVCAAVLVTSWLGIVSRPLGHLAALWPANAALLGLMLRYPRLASPAGWFGAVIGYYSADLLTGGAVFATTLLTAGNLAGVVPGYLMFSRLDQEHQRLRRPLSVLYLGLCIVVASASAGLMGAVLDPLLFNGTPWHGWIYWFVTEAVNYMAILPVILALPDLSGFALERRQGASKPGQLIVHLAPVFALIASCLLGIAIGGPGAVAFPVPALLWCALTYGVFTNTLLTFFYACWTLIAISLGFMANTLVDMNSWPMLLSTRLGVMLIALAPITLSSVMTARNELLESLRFMAERDELSGLLNRRAFRSRASEWLERLTAERRPVALLMMDIDKFKSVNDGHGHAAGDKVLVAFSRIAGLCLRDGDPFGRVGGEEFSVLLPGCGLDEALQIAERVRAGFSAVPIDLGIERGVPLQLKATVSIGMVYSQQATNELDILLGHADRALYRAKAAGRDRVDFDEYLDY